MGIVWIIKDSYILRKPRNFLKSKFNILDEFLSCSLCIGFWVGLIISLVNIYTHDSPFVWYFAFASSAFCWLVDSILDLIQECTVYYKNIRENS